MISKAFVYNKNDDVLNSEIVFENEVIERDIVRDIVKGKLCIRMSPCLCFLINPLARVQRGPAGGLKSNYGEGTFRL